MYGGYGVIEVRTFRRPRMTLRRNYQSMDDELERFKLEIPILDVAIDGFGYSLDRSKSSRASKTLRGMGDTVIVTRAEDGHDVYFARRDQADCGSVIDFVKHRIASNNLGQARKFLREWLPGSSSPPIRKPLEVRERPDAVSRDLISIMEQWNRLVPYEGRYLVEDRQLPPDLIRSFGVRQDERGNACFGHRGAVDEQSITGWERKNRGFTGFTAGGVRGLMTARLDRDPIAQIVVAEASIDAMSWAQLRNRPAGTAYVSIGGEPSPEQLEMLRRVLARNHGASIIIATDNDPGGDHLAERVAAVAPEGVLVDLDRPPKRGQDWNDVLCGA